MDLIADVLLIAGALGAALYCMILARRIKSLSRLDTGLGGAISALSAQVEDMRASVKAATQASGTSMKDLMEVTGRAEIAAGRLELLLSTVHERGQPPKPVKLDRSDEPKILKAMKEQRLDEDKDKKESGARAELLTALQQVMTAVKR
ncbi:MAG: hypothetical protein COB08_018845 [Rhodobacteraceae bacterium]|nr:hypothetical protein [Paracoccaceae bacterium]